MNQEIEIEFKNMLSKSKYDELLTAFDINRDSIIRQENHYFDTPDFQLKALASGLRIRILPNKIECTLKEQANENTHIETTDLLTVDEATQMTNGLIFPASNVKARLIELGIDVESLSLFGSLVTDRVEIAYKGGLLVLDHSYYLQCDDYEVEYETQDEIVGKNIFRQFLVKYNIPVAHAQKKIARFAAALAASQSE
ncbi:CYTH domain-containing protein [Solibacillus sp. CAU 1738]